ncbi:efflux RND transporter periplasmic adaptor subunit [Pseudomonas stutzeri]|uniref:efflux RND transporter periplasmic adaptor subunit n=1 Tax=Stutzerimonas stutzeri TaxID=316 RepID=UPI000C9C0D4C|nr:efflux RND transporter periplasmic adaptor subunit [Stutzerimonas stutzeri]MCQ4279000.1 efflux RND transporter periplasmic adaptor subunit [Stutzerimonas stutzeri]PNF74688.1 efflux RND transporter periplasmic adaptor subunit [Stutzerimonas stutzeri]
MCRHALPFLGAFGFALLAGCGNGEPEQLSTRPVMVVQPQPASEAFESYPGEVHARYEPELAFRIGGKVTERMVEAGERVRKDQPLAKLDPQDVRLQLEGIRAQVAAAEANLRVARAEHERYKTLMDRQLVSRSQFDSSENAYRSAQARLQQARAEFDVANNQVGYAILRATHEGVIAQRRVEVGQVVGAGQTAFVLAADGEREVAINLPEQALDRYSVGQPVSVEIWSQPGKTYAGHIRELSPAADPQSRTYSARVAFDDAKVPAELGQSALVSIRSNGEVPLAVPLSAVTAEQGKAYVWRVKEDGTLERVAVQTGAFGDSSVPILKGLQADDWVVLAGVQMLHENQSVRAVDRDNRPVELAAQE